MSIQVIKLQGHGIHFNDLFLYCNSSWLLKSDNSNIAIVTEDCFLTIIIAASLEVLVIVQAMRLNAVVSISVIHEGHSECISFLCPQHWTWVNAVEQ